MRCILVALCMRRRVVCGRSRIRWVSHWVIECLPTTYYATHNLFTGCLCVSAHLILARTYLGGTNVLKLACNRNFIPLKETERGSHYQRLSPFTSLFLNKFSIIRLFYFWCLSVCLSEVWRAEFVSVQMGPRTSLLSAEVRPLFAEPGVPFIGICRDKEKGATDRKGSRRLNVNLMASMKIYNNWMRNMYCKLITLKPLKSWFICSSRCDVIMVDWYS